MTMNIILLFCTLVTFISCNGQSQKFPKKKIEKIIGINVGDTVSNLGKDIDFIFQDLNSNYWFASNGEGVFRYDGKNILQITEKDGLCSNFVWEVQEDTNGKLWFSTRDGICNFDGKKFTDYTDTIKNAAYGPLNYKRGGLFFNHLDGICFYDGKSFTNFVIHPLFYKPETSSMYRPFGVYRTFVDNSGKVWFGTQEKGVCVYDGKRFSFLTDKNLAGPAVRSIFQDKKGTFWFGNNGGGLFCYDRKTLRNITEEKNLGNSEFLNEKKLVDKPGSLARVFAINEDMSGNLWIGTADAGVWKYDGTNLTNYTSNDGLSGNSVTVIYKDKNGELLFVSNGDSVLRFDGNRFKKFKFD
jgi:ligand-binding sensor domain-containing protein